MAQNDTNGGNPFSDMFPPEIAKILFDEIGAVRSELKDDTLSLGRELKEEIQVVSLKVDRLEGKVDSLEGKIDDLSLKVNQNQAPLVQNIENLDKRVTVLEMAR